MVSAGKNSRRRTLQQASRGSSRKRSRQEQRWPLCPKERANESKELLDSNCAIHTTTIAASTTAAATALQGSADRRMDRCGGRRKEAPLLPGVLAFLRRKPLPRRGQRERERERDNDLHPYLVMVLPDQLASNPASRLALLA